MKLETKVNWAIGLSIAAIALATIMFVLWCCNAGGFSAISLDTFVGVIVALLAIIVTFVLGWQIFNIFELKNKIDEVNELKSQFEKQNACIDELSIKTEHRLFLTWGDIAFELNQYDNAVYYYIISLSHSLKLHDPINVPKLITMLQAGCGLISAKVKLDTKSKENLCAANKRILESPYFCCIKDNYERIYSQYIQNVELDDSQK